MVSIGLKDVVMCFDSFLNTDKHGLAVSPGLKDIRMCRSCVSYTDKHRLLVSIRLKNIVFDASFETHHNIFQNKEDTLKNNVKRYVEYCLFDKALLQKRPIILKDISGSVSLKHKSFQNTSPYLSDLDTPCHGVTHCQIFQTKT